MLYLLAIAISLSMSGGWKRLPFLGCAALRCAACLNAQADYQAS
jgi:hypothetical protein